jgi:hypothetical protein
LITVRKSKIFSSNSSQVSEDANYIESCFSTYLYTGNGSTQTITNGIDLSGKGGLVWRKLRSAAGDNILEDTVRGAGNYLLSNATNASAFSANLITSFGTTGFTTGPGSNASSSTYASWTFREQPKFFDVVTYTGNGTNQVINHSLTSNPGCIIIKCTSDADQWMVYHRSLGTSKFIYLNTTGSEQTFSWLSSVGGTSFTLDGGSSLYNASGRTYVAYVFAHDAGGFGLTGTDNVISCGSFTTDGSANATVNLGYEPQWVMWKSSTASDLWQISDTMRGWSNRSGGRNWLRANESDAETVGGDGFPTSTGFEARGLSGSQTYIYIAIRRGPMKVPTTGTSVFSPAIRTGTGSAATISGLNFPPDLVIDQIRGASGNATTVADRLRGRANYLATTNTDAEQTTSSSTQDITSFNMDGISLGTSFNSAINGTGNTTINWFFRRAPGFFDEVCYTGTGVARTVAHNLAAVPELMIIKGRSYVEDWAVYSASLPNTQALRLNSAGSPITNSLYWNSTTPTSSVFTVGTRVEVNNSGGSIVAYLFATCPGVSKVGSYTGNGSSQTINCGFTGGARFVMIKRTDDTGDWYVWDTARGIVSGNDPHLSLNTTAAEVTTDDTIDTDSTGFVVNQVSATNVNVSSATYIFLAIA